MKQYPLNRNMGIDDTCRNLDQVFVERHCFGLYLYTLSTLLQEITSTVWTVRCFAVHLITNSRRRPSAEASRGHRGVIYGWKHCTFTI